MSSKITGQGINYFRALEISKAVNAAGSKVKAAVAKKGKANTGAATFTLAAAAAQQTAQAKAAAKAAQQASEPKVKQIPREGKLFGYLQPAVYQDALDRLPLMQGYLDTLAAEVQSTDGDAAAQNANDELGYLAAAIASMFQPFEVRADKQNRRAA